jgi:hypothetical protein
MPVTYNKKIENTQILKHNVYYTGSVAERSTNFRTKTAIDLMLRRYENTTIASMKNPQL